MGTSLDEADRSPKQLSPGFYGVGDDAFVNSNTLLTPWSGVQLTFNYQCYLCDNVLSERLEFTCIAVRPSLVIGLPF
jgi:hypothetical protein